MDFPISHKSVIVLVMLALTLLSWGWLLRAGSTNSEAYWIDGAATELSYVGGAAGQILLPARADGMEVGPCLLDSGAQAKMMMVSSSSARRAGLDTFRLLPFSIARGSYGSTGIVRNRTAGQLQVGPIAFRRPRLVEVSDRDMSLIEPSGLALPIGSICSCAVFKAATIEIDWRGETVAFYKPDLPPMRFGSLEWLPLVEYQGLPAVRMRVEDRLEGLFLIDTGMTSAIHFYSHAVQEYQLLAGRSVQHQIRRGIGGSATVLTGQIQSVTLSRYRAAPVLATFDTAERHGAERGVSGRIGIALLRHFRTIIDMPNNRVAFVAYE